MPRSNDMDDARVARILKFCEGMRADDMDALKALLRGDSRAEPDNLVLDDNDADLEAISKAQGMDAALVQFRKRYGLPAARRPRYLGP
jgi:hypothetical protein